MYFIIGPLSRQYLKLIIFFMTNMPADIQVTQHTSKKFPNRSVNKSAM
jgi:hypothetical protein